jgi:hypothetical protein
MIFLNTTISKYKDDLNKLLNRGKLLKNAMALQVYPEKTKKQIKKIYKDKTEKIIDKFPDFTQEYQTWYSEGKVLLKQLLPDRLEDFQKFYEKPKGRKSITYESYRIEDSLQCLVIKRNDKEIVGLSAAIPHFLQQLAIIKAAKQRFESSLFDIQQTVQADLFDSEIDAASDLHKKKFYRAAGVISGIVLEKHLNQACLNHSIKINRKNPTISVFNALLKENNVYDIALFRKIQYLGDVRNKCGHDTKTEPNKEEVKELIDGVSKITKTLF